MTDCTRKRTRAAACAAVLFVAAACTNTPSPPNAAAPYPQQAGYPQQPGYPQQAPYPQQAGYPPQGYQQSYPQQAAYPQQPESHPIRDLFASTIAAVLQTTTSGIAGAITGGIMNWFATKSNHGNPQNAYASSYGAYPNTGYGSTSTYPNSSYPTSSYPTSGYPAASYPNTASTYPNTASTYPSTASTYPNTASTYPNTASTYPNTASTYPSATTSYPNSGYPSSQYPATASAYPNGTPQYPASTYPDPNAANAGYPQAGQYPNSTYPQQQTSGAYASNATNGAYGSTGQMVAARDTDVYAGIAYEVHALSADGHWTPVDPTTYAFKSGDRFMVYYRPSLPGRMQIYNVNPSGQQTLIDATDMAAGQLAGLGPYEFTNQTGDESLRLVLSPCSTPQLLVATRDIVKVDAPPPSSADTGGGVHLSNCSAVATRGVDIHARGIDAIGRDGLTTFALDQVSTRELASGDVDPRQVTIVFHHR